MSDLKYQYNSHIFCSKCNKERYMGYTSKSDSQLCVCLKQNEIPVYDKRTEVKELVSIDKFYIYG